MKLSQRNSSDISSFKSFHIINTLGEKRGFFPPPTKQNRFDLSNIFTIPIPPFNILEINKLNGLVWYTLNPISVPMQKYEES